MGPEAIAWIREQGVLGDNDLLPWQSYALTRALELKRDRSLRWKVVVIGVARQNGKSWLVRAIAAWRMHQAERFGEPQLVLGMAQMIDTAIEVWDPAARWAVERYGSKAAKWGRGAEEIILPDRVGRWKLQAASNRAAVGFSVNMGIVDEAAMVDVRIVNNNLRPTLSRRKDAQIWLISTEGDADSTLLHSYKEQGLADRDGTGDVLVLDWSAPPEADITLPGTWKWANPYWNAAQEAELRSSLASVSESAFRREQLNQPVVSADGWIPAGVWKACESPLVPTGRPDVVAVEAADDHSRFAAVRGWLQEDGRIVVRGFAASNQSAVWEWIEQNPASQLLLGASLERTYKRRQRPELVGTQDHVRGLGPVARMIHDTLLLHAADDHALNTDMGHAVATVMDTGIRLSRKRSTGPIEVARALVFAAGHLTTPRPAKPMIVSA